MGGAETSLYHLVTNLDEGKYTPVVALREEGALIERLKAKQIPTVILKLPEWRKLKSLPHKYLALNKLVKLLGNPNSLGGTNPIRLIHANTIWINHYAQLAGRRLNLPVVCHLRDIVSKDRVIKYGLHKIDLVIPISDAVRTPLDEAGIYSSNIRKIYNGVDTASFNPDNFPVNVLTRDFGLKGLLIGIVGQLTPRSEWKGHIDFLRAAAEVLRTKPDAEVNFVIIGGDTSSPTKSDYMSYVRKLENLTSELGISERVTFTGFRSDMPQVMASLDILVSASWAEPFGRTIIEAMASGKPVIGTKAGGAVEIIEDSITGLLVPPKAPTLLAQTMMKLIDNVDARMNMGLAGRKRAEDHFSLRQNVRKTEEIYAELTG